MTVKEYEAWLARNEGKGGKRPSLDPYNKVMKGKERNPSAAEFSNMNTEEYHHYSERYMQKKYEDDEDKRQDGSSSTSENKNKRSDSSKTGGASRSAGQVLRNVIPRVVAVAASAVVIVTGYQAIKANAIASASWNWNEDHTAIVGFIDGNGELVKEIPASVSVEEVAPTCNEAGSLTYTAVVDEDGETYTDTKVEVLSPTGHTFGEGRDIVLDNGEHATEFECEHCHEKFIISNDVVEED